MVIDQPSLYRKRGERDRNGYQVGKSQCGASERHEPKQKQRRKGKMHIAKKRQQP